MYLTARKQQLCKTYAERASLASKSYSTRL